MLVTLLQDVDGRFDLPTSAPHIARCPVGVAQFVQRLERTPNPGTRLAPQQHRVQRVPCGLVCLFLLEGHRARETTS